MVVVKVARENGVPLIVLAEDGGNGGERIQRAGLP